MFTGIIEELGTVAAAMESRAAGARLVVRCATVLSEQTRGPTSFVTLNLVHPSASLTTTSTLGDDNSE